MRWCREAGGGPRPAPWVAIVAALATLATAGAAAAYLDRPPPAHTGGFAEPTCALCHRGAPLDAPGGSLHLAAPETFVAGDEYLLEVRLVRDGMERAGFELSARFAEGKRAGRQAGELGAPSPQVRVAVAHDVAYAGHTVAGAAAVADGEARWQVRWRAPAAGAGPVVFHLAANAGNFDDSELGDFVYLTSAVSRPDAS